MHRRGIQQALRSGRPGTAWTAERLERAEARLLRVLDRDLQTMAGRAGDWLRCRPGCSQCCHGPFPITRLDARRLERGMTELRRRDPSRAAAVTRRAERASASMRDGFPGDSERGRLLADERTLDEFFERHEGRACAALDPDTGRCELYEWRPVSCRTYGPPARFGRQRSAPCSLCFQGASPGTVESCRLEPDPEGLEDAILRKMGVEAGQDWETLIPFALAAAEPTPEETGKTTP